MGNYVKYVMEDISQMKMVDVLILIIVKSQIKESVLNAKIIILNMEKKEDFKYVNLIHQKILFIVRILIMKQDFATTVKQDIF